MTSIKNELIKFLKSMMIILCLFVGVYLVVYMMLQAWDSQYEMDYSYDSKMYYDNSFKSENLK